jgi:ketosteroid isomerase-like protein
MTDILSPSDLPPVIGAYFAADRASDLDTLASCFTTDAVVRDEGRDHAGKDAIRRWKAEASRAYSYTATPFAIVEEGDRAILSSHLVGDFPGSPVDLRYAFRLLDGRIAALEIRT